LGYLYQMQNIDLAKVLDTVAFIKTKLNFTPQAGVILGSGLSGLVEATDIEFRLDYRDIPNFPVSTVEGHGGQLIFGELGGKKIVLMSGRFHYYEGYNMQEVTFPIRVMKYLGIEVLMVSNAAGGMNANFKVGDLMVIKDHINLFPEHPLRGKNNAEVGPRFPDMSEPYDMALVAKAHDIAKQNNIELHQGVYIGLQGPTFETRAEYKYLHIIGGDTVGMSTVPEVIVARHMGIKVFGMSVVTDLGIRDELNIITHEEVLEAAHAAAPKMALLFSQLLASM
jgi:purine-nucleoside phosphorylase